MTQQAWNNAAYPAAGYWPGTYGQAAQYRQPAADPWFGENPYAASGYPVYGSPSRQATNGMAIAALVLGVASALAAMLGIGLVLFAVMGAPAGIVGLVLGTVARGKVRERQQRGTGMAIAGIATAAGSLAIDLLLIVWSVSQLIILFG